jgi:hypothetical protein
LFLGGHERSEEYELASATPADVFELTQAAASLRRAKGAEQIAPNQLFATPFGSGDVVDYERGLALAPERAWRTAALRKLELAVGRAKPAWHACRVDPQLTEGAPHPLELAANAARAFSMWLSACTVAALCLVGTVVRASEPSRIPVVFHLAQLDGEAVAPPAFIAEQLAAANAIYGPLGIDLVERDRVPLAAVHAELLTRADRDALVRHVRKGAIHCFVVAKLMDVDEPGRERRGVHWHPRSKPQLSFLIISKISKPYVLAHELGHLFGNPKHSDVPGNLMSYERTAQTPFLDAAQIRNVQRTLAALRKNGTLVPLPSVP